MKSNRATWILGAALGAVGFVAGYLPAQSTSNIGALGAKLGIVEIPATDVGGLVDFYHNVLDLSDDFTFARNFSEFESYHFPVSHDGISLQINERTEDDSRPIPWFLVDDLDASIAAVTGNGGSVVDSPFDIVLSEESYEALVGIYGDQLGGAADGGEVFARVAFTTDPEGNEVALMEVDVEGHPHFNDGDFANPLDPETLENHGQVAGL